MALFDLSHKAIEAEWNQKAKALLVFRVGKFFLMYLKMPYGLICESLGLAIQIVCKAKNCSIFWPTFGDEIWWQTAGLQNYNCF